MRTSYALALAALLVLSGSARAEERNVNMEGHAGGSIGDLSVDRLPELRAALDDARRLAFGLRQAVDRDLQDESGQVTSLVHRSTLFGINYWTVSDAWRQPFIDVCGRVYAICDVGDYYWSVRHLLEGLQNDLGSPDRGPRNEALVRVRYELLPGMLDQLDKSDAALAKRDGRAAARSYEALSAEGRAQCRARMDSLRTSLQRLLTATRRAVGDPSLALLEHRGILGLNGWYVASTFRQVINGDVQAIYQFHAVTDRAGTPSNLHRILSYVARHVTGRLGNDLGAPDESARVKALLKLRDDSLPEALRLLAEEEPLLRATDVAAAPLSFLGLEPQQ